MQFHSAVAAWFEQTFTAPTHVQVEAWQVIARHEHALLAAPTGSGKTLAAFLASINALVEEGLAKGLSQHTRILYVSPLKALSNDIQKNLQIPLQGIRESLEEQGYPDVDIQAWVRTGDTPQNERQKALRKPPHIVVTTPESLYILLTSQSGRKMLSTVETVIVDEIHALAGNKRGAHLTLSLERLEALTPQPLQRIALSATQKPIENMAHFLMGARDAPIEIIDTGHSRARDMQVVVPPVPLEAVMSAEVWQCVYDQLAEQVNAHQTTLIFVNTRRHAERVAKFLAERLGPKDVTSHHGSLSREHRLDAENRLKAGQLRCLVATASLELGIDIGDVDLVCQLGSPRSISGFLQRVGRSGHSIGQTPKGRLFPLSRDDLVECVALIAAVEAGQLDYIHSPEQPMDVLAQSIVAEVADQAWAVADLHACFSRAWPYRKLSLEDFIAVIRMLADGYATRRGRRGAHLHYDAINGQVRGRKGARLLAITNGGAIPDLFDYEVILSPEGLRVGSLNEDFSFESLPGDIFQLGNTCYRILRVEQGKVHVEDARGQPPNIPFWLGEAPGRTDELTDAVSQLRQTINRALDDGDVARCTDFIRESYALEKSVAQQLVGYLAAAKAALSVIPHHKTIVLERFFDDSGDMHLVIHSPFGSRINRAWGLGLRKRFCRKFNFELQAAALEDSIVLSLSISHSFPLEEVMSYLHARTARQIVIQAMLDAPMFATHWRWNASIALAVPRFRAGKRNPPVFQRNDAEDLMAVVFPDQLACFENLAGEREVPDHPLVTQTIEDCLTDVMDIAGLERVLTQIQAGDITVVGRDLSAPSVLSAEVLNARPYAFLDDAPAEERRTLAIQGRSSLQLDDAAALGELDEAALVRLHQEIQPQPRDADELHDALMVFGFITEIEAEQGGDSTALEFGWRHYLEHLIAQNRATRLRIHQQQTIWVAAERLTQLMAVCGQLEMQPEIALPPGDSVASWDSEAALLEIIRSRMEGLGPTTVEALAQPLGIDAAMVERALLALEQEGFVARGTFTQTLASEAQWCERRLLARLHRYTIKRLRSSVKTVSATDFMRFLLHWQGLSEPAGGVDATLSILTQLEGFAVAAQAWEAVVLRRRVEFYTPDLIDHLCLAGRISWMRLQVVASDGQKQGPIKQSPIALMARENVALWRELAPLPLPESLVLSANAQTLMASMRCSGAAFFSDLLDSTRLLRSQLEDALGELVNHGLVTADGYAGLRALVNPQKARQGGMRGRRGVPQLSPFDQAGRWSLLSCEPVEHPSDAALELLVWRLLQRYGVVFRQLLEREPSFVPWRDLLRVFWRLEARGEIRGGRFVAGMVGEQFALPEAVAALGQQVKAPPDDRLHLLSACDPLNLLGIILGGDKLAATPNHFLVLCNGLPLAVERKGELELLQALDELTVAEIKRLLATEHKQRKAARTGRMRFH